MALAGLVLVLVLPAESRAAAATTERVSVSSSGVEQNRSGFDLDGPSISADGRFVAFVSGEGSNLGSGSGSAQGVFIRDRQAGTTRLVSVNSAGEPADDASFEPSVSADGRYVAFMSYATNLGEVDPHAGENVFVDDLVTGSTKAVSVSSMVVPGNEYSAHPSISADGRFVAFSSNATNLAPGATRPGRKEFVHDMASGQTEQVNVSSAGKAGNGDCHAPSISANGRYVAFESNASNLVPGTKHKRWNVYVHDTERGKTTEASVGLAGKAADGPSFHPSISGDGHFVAFESQARNLVHGDTNKAWDVFVRDLGRRRTTRVSVNSAGRQGNGDSRFPALSKHGGFVAFQSKATNLVPQDHGKASDVYFHDARGKRSRTELVSVDTSGRSGLGDSDEPSVSADGRFVAFYSSVATLVPNDTNHTTDAFARGPMH